jgi:hypothetical protein
LTSVLLPHSVVDDDVVDRRACDRIDQIGSVMGEEDAIPHRGARCDIVAGRQREGGIAEEDLPTRKIVR